MKSKLQKFAANEVGNAILDWTVLMTGVVLFAVAVVATLEDGAVGSSEVHGTRVAAGIASS